MKKGMLMMGVALLGSALHAQTTAALLPAPPAGVVYRFWPRQLVQWLSADSPWSMIELDVDDRGAKPLYHVVMTRRADGHRAQYTNLPEELAIDQASGGDAHLVPMALDGPPEPANGSSYQLRFATEAHVPVTWQFVLGSDVSEQGSGVTVVNAPAPIFLYREQGAVAAQGTAVKIGNATYAAEVWNEISQPPYFVAYHGALSTDVHVLAFVPQATEWKRSSPAPAITAGAEWDLTSSRTGTQLHAHVEKAGAGTATVRETSARGGFEITLDERQTPDGWTLERARYVPSGVSGDHSVTLTIAPGAPSKFDLVAGKKTRLASGTVMTTNSAGSLKQSWSFKDPASASKQPVEASISETTEAAGGVPIH